jgi:hypothetical protein
LPSLKIRRLRTIAVEVFFFKGHLHTLQWHELSFHVWIKFSKCSNDVSCLKWLGSSSRFVQHYTVTNSMLNFYPPFLCRVLAAILKMADILNILKRQNCSSNGDLSLCQSVCLYHYLFRSYHWFPTLQNFYRSPFSKWPPQYR